MKRVLEHYEGQSEQQAVAEDEAASEQRDQTLMEVPNELVPAIRELIAKRPSERSSAVSRLVDGIYLERHSTGGGGHLQGRFVAAILMSAGFFTAAIGPDRTTPNRLIVLVWLGALSLTAGVLTLGIGLLTA